MSSSSNSNHPDNRQTHSSIARSCGINVIKKSSFTNWKSKSVVDIRRQISWPRSLMTREYVVILPHTDTTINSNVDNYQSSVESVKKVNFAESNLEPKDHHQTLSEVVAKKSSIKISLRSNSLTTMKKVMELGVSHSPDMLDRDSSVDDLSVFSDISVRTSSINSRRLGSMHSVKNAELKKSIGRRSLPNKPSYTPLKTSFGSINMARRRLETLQKKEKAFQKSREVKKSERPKLKQIHLRLEESDVKLAIKAIQKRNIRRKLSRDYEKTSVNEPVGVRLRRSLKEAYESGRIKGSFINSRKLSELSQNEDFSDDASVLNTKSVHLYEIQSNRAILKTIQNIRYRENIYRVATRLTQDIPMYPDWTYQDENIKYLDILTINVGGHIFQIFEDVLSSLHHTKLASCLLNHQSVGIPFFDRDYVCFSAVLNFYRTGKLHVPADTCLTFFEEELEFWGLSEQFFEPCCWNEYESIKVATNTLKKYAEDQDKDENFKNLDEKTCLNLRMKLYRIMTAGTGSVLARWVSTICAVFIILSISLMFTATTAFGRIDVKDASQVTYNSFETITKFLKRTQAHPKVTFAELFFSGFFLSELIIRLILCPNRLEFFSDTFNWIDLTATTTSLLSNIFTVSDSTSHFEGYMLLLKLPRIFRLFKLTAGLRTGMEAFTLTIRACATELKLIFFILFIATAVFGALIFVVEMVNEDHAAEGKEHISNIYLGMWLAFASMTAVGFGDYVPQTNIGYLCTSFIIMCGIIICQLPVPIVLKNFGIYNNQASARLNQKNSLKIHCTDPESIADDDANERAALRKRSIERYTRMISQYKR